MAAYLRSIRRRPEFFASRDRTSCGSSSSWAFEGGESKMAKRDEPFEGEKR